MLCKYTQSTLDLCYMATHLLLLISLVHPSYMHFRKKWALNHVFEKNIQFFKERVHSPLACSVANFSYNSVALDTITELSLLNGKSILRLDWSVHWVDSFWDWAVGDTESLLISLHLILFLLLEWAECPLRHRTFP